MEDTTFRKCGAGRRTRASVCGIAECSNEISLWFELHTPEARENALYKINTLLGALERFRAALDAEAELYEHREQHRRKEVRAR